MTTVKVIFSFLENPGFIQIKGSTRGPTERKTNTNIDFLKYHFCFASSIRRPS